MKRIMSIGIILLMVPMMVLAKPANFILECKNWNDSSGEEKNELFMYAFDAANSGPLDNLKAIIELKGLPVNCIAGRDYKTYSDDYNDYNLKIGPYSVDQDTSLLMAAAQGGKYETVEYLLSKGADINHKISNDGLSPGLNPLFSALREKNFKVAALLISKGADINNKYKKDFGAEYSYSPLSYALQLQKELIQQQKEITDLVNALKAKGAK